MHHNYHLVHPYAKIELILMICCCFNTTYHFYRFKLDKIERRFYPCQLHLVIFPLCTQLSSQPLKTDKSNCQHPAQCFLPPITIDMQQNKTGESSISSSDSEQLLESPKSKVGIVRWISNLSFSSQSDSQSQDSGNLKSFYRLKSNTSLAPFNHSLLCKVPSPMRRLLLCCGLGDSSDEYDPTKVEFGKPFPTKYIEQEIPYTLDSIIKYLISKCQMHKGLFVEHLNSDEVKACCELLKQGYKIYPDEYDSIILTEIIMVYLEKIPGGVFTKYGEDLLMTIPSYHCTDHQHSLYHKAILSMHPIARLLIRQLMHLWFAILNNSFINDVNIINLSYSLAKVLFINSKHTKGVDECAQVLQFIFNNRKIARSVLYAHLRFDINKSSHEFNQILNGSDSFGLNGSRLSILSDRVENIKKRKDKRLSLLCSNMSMDKIGIDKLIETTTIKSYDTDKNEINGDSEDFVQKNGFNDIDQNYTSDPTD